jgi:hypothetical protein
MCSPSIAGFASVLVEDGAKIHVTCPPQRAGLSILGDLVSFVVNGALSLNAWIHWYTSTEVCSLKRRMVG